MLIDDADCTPFSFTLGLPQTMYALMSSLKLMLSFPTTETCHFFLVELKSIGGKKMKDKLMKTDDFSSNFNTPNLEQS